MLHILLLILKIIGIVILCILGLALVLTAIILFVPIRYRINGGYDGKPVLKGRVYFLFHSVSLHLDYDSGISLKEVVYRLKILGVTIKSNRKKKPGTGRSGTPLKSGAPSPAGRDTTQKRILPEASGPAETQTPPETGRPQPAETPLPTETGTPQPAETPLPTETGMPQPAEKSPPGIPQEGEAPRPAVIPSHSEAPRPAKSPQPAAGWKDRIRALWRRIGGFWKKVTEFFRRLWKKLENIPYTIKKMCDRMNQLQETILYYRTLWESDEMKRAVSLCKKQLRYLYRKLKPRLFKCRLMVGMEDPYITGQILTYYCMAYPWIGNNVVLTADFENTVFEGDFVLKGHVRIFTLIKAAVIVYFNKNIRNILKKLKREDIGNGGK